MKTGFIRFISGFFVILAGGCGIDNFQTTGQKKTISIQNKPNIILITISSLRSDHVNSMGYYRQTTPNFDKFASSNNLFTNTFATSSWQMPATGSIFTSLYPAEHGATNINKKLDPKAKTIAEILKEKGFYTAGFCCNPRLSGDYGFGKGFDFYDDYSVSVTLSSMAFSQDNSFDINKKRTNDLINNAAIRWLQNNTHKPFFLFVHYYDNHWDYLPPEPFDRLYDPNYKGYINGIGIAGEPLYSNKPSEDDIKHIIALYDGEVRQTDDDLGELLNFLKEQGKFKDSLIIVMGDHGTQFYEHNHTGNRGIFDELIYIPLAISVPHPNGSKVIDSLVSGVDVMPTILDYASVSLPSNCKGKSLKDVIEGKKEKIRDFIYAEYIDSTIPDCFAVRFDQSKFVEESNQIFAYDLMVDPLEQRKIYKKEFGDKMNLLFATIESLLMHKSASQGCNCP